MKVIAKTIYKKGFILEWSTDFMDGYKPTIDKTDNDIQVVLKTEKGKYLADAICHFGSYGVQNNLWEIMCEHPLKKLGDSVRGHLTFKEVQKIFDREIRLYETT